MGVLFDWLSGSTGFSSISACSVPLTLPLEVWEDLLLKLEEKTCYNKNFITREINKSLKMECAIQTRTELKPN